MAVPGVARISPGSPFPLQRTSCKGSKPSLRIIAVEPTACPSLTKGKYAYDFGDTVGLTPLVKMHTLGHTFVPAPVHAGGLRYHGMAPLVCKLYDEGSIEAVAVPQLGTFAGSPAVRAHGRHSAGPRVGTRHTRGYRRGAALQGGRASADDSV